MQRPVEWSTLSPEQLAFVFSGKRYLLARLVAQLTWIIAFLVRLYTAASLSLPMIVSGAVLVIAGFVVRRWSMCVMGERFRGYEVRREERGLETRGPYAVVRHPGYLGLVLMDVGMPLLVSWPWGLLLSMLLVGLVIQRITIEERALRNVYAEYDAYAAARSRLIPGVW